MGTVTRRTVASVVLSALLGLVVGYIAGGLDWAGYTVLIVVLAALIAVAAIWRGHNRRD